MLALRFANGIFEPIWNRQFIDHVQITVAESIGLEGRAALLRAGGRDPRHLPEPPAAAARADGDGAADRVPRRRGAQREGQGAALAPHARAEARRARPVRARLRRGRARCPGYREEPRRRAGLDDGDVRRGQALRGQLALGGHAVLRARAASGCRAARRRSRSSSSARRTRRSRRRRPRGCGRTCCSSTCSRTRASRSASARRCPASGMIVRTVTMDFFYGGAFRTALPEAYERLLLDAMLGDADALHPRGRDRGAVVDRRRDRLHLGARPAQLPELRSRYMGAAFGRRACSIATGAPGGGTDWRRPEPGRAADVRLADVEEQAARALRRGRRAAATEAPNCSSQTRVMTHFAWVPPEWLDARARDARGAGRAAPLALDHPRPGARRAEDGLDAEVRLQCYAVEGMQQHVCSRGDRAAAARRSSRGAGERRAAAPRRRPAGVPALARPAAVRRRRRSRALVDVVDRLIVDSTEWPDLPDAYARAGARSSSAPPSRTSPGRARAAGARQLAVALAGHRRGASGSRSTGTQAQAHLLARLAALAAAAGESTSSTRRPTASSASRWTARPRPFPPGDRPPPSELLSRRARPLRPRPRLRGRGARGGRGWTGACARRHACRAPGSCDRMA